MVYKLFDIDWKVITNSGSVIFDEHTFPAYVNTKQTAGYANTKQATGYANTKQTAEWANDATAVEEVVFDTIHVQYQPAEVITGAQAQIDQNSRNALYDQELATPEEAPSDEIATRDERPRKQQCTTPR